MLIAQITDSHIVPKGTYWKNEPTADTAGRLSRAVAYLNERSHKPDVVLFTGDAVEKGDSESYRHFRELIKPLQFPFFVVPGNHDDREEMRSCFADQPYMPSKGLIHYCIDEFPVRLIGLDTLVSGKNFGEVSPEQVFWLEKILSNDKPSLIFLHHPPVKVGTKSFDTNYSCHWDPAFETVVQKNKCLLGSVAGHYHLLCTSSFGGKSCFLAPSLAPNYYFAHPDDLAPSALEFDDPAVTLHRWLGGTHFSTHVVYLKEDYRRIPLKGS